MNPPWLWACVMDNKEYLRDCNTNNCSINVYVNVFNNKMCDNF